MTPGVVRVYSVDLDPPADVGERLDTILPLGERDAPAPIRVARAATRVLLAETLGIEPAQVVISRACAHCGHPTHGRPTVSADPDISFSLSHSGAFAAIAIAAGDACIGVDVETVRPRARLDALAARVLGDEEHAEWLALDDPDARLHTFLRAWTAKEAYLKALGIGIATPLRDVPAHVDGWSSFALDLGAERVGTLAVDRAEFSVEQVVLSTPAMSNGGTAH